MTSLPGPYGLVLSNLVLNSALHAFPDGTMGTISFKARAFGDDDVEILFSDDGCGMSPQIRRQAFDPFFTTRRHEGATGLGLHIVHSMVVDRLGGRMALTSEFWRGHNRPPDPAANDQVRGRRHGHGGQENSVFRSGQDVEKDRHDE